MRHTSCGTLEELRSAERALFDKGFTRTASRPQRPKEYCFQKDADAKNGEEHFILIWETEDEWFCNWDHRGVPVPAANEANG